jgi:tRNA modification GTPase
MILLFDATAVETEEVLAAISQLSDKRFLLLFNKIDLIEQPVREALAGRFAQFEPLFASARDLIGIDQVLSSIHDRILGSKESVPLEHTLTNRRHFDAMNASLEALQNVEAGLGDEQSFELLAFDLRRCISHLEGILGKVTSEDLLAEIFGRFCIGK